MATMARAKWTTRLAVWDAIGQHWGRWLDGGPTDQSEVVGAWCFGRNIVSQVTTEVSREEAKVQSVGPEVVVQSFRREVMT